jgi:hypothetical protein
MKRFYLLSLFLVVFILNGFAQKLYFQYQGHKVSNWGTVTINAEPDSFSPNEKSCMTNPPSNPKNGLVFVAEGKSGVSGSATMEIQSNTLSPTMIQWCMGGVCQLMTGTTKLTKSFTTGADGTTQVDFDATNVAAEGSLEASLSVTVDGESVMVTIKFVSGNITGISHSIDAHEKAEKCYDLNGFQSVPGSRGIYIRQGKKYLNP